MRISDDVMDVLNASTIEAGVLLLPSGQLDRKLYESVNKCLMAMGGKWNRNAKGHTFDRDPSDLLENVLRTGELFDRKKVFQFFETPVALAERMATMAELKPSDDVLEPSAGRGRIAMALRKHKFRRLTMVEIDPVSHLRLAALTIEGVLRGDLVLGDFLQETTPPIYSKIVMNPPFSRNQDIAHVRHAHQMLAPGGRLIAIMSEHGFFAKDQASVDFREWLGNAEAEKLPAGAFDQSGTGVNTRLVVIDKAAQ